MPATLIQTGPSAAKKRIALAPNCCAPKNFVPRLHEVPSCRSTIAPCGHPGVVRRLAAAGVGRGGGRVEVEVRRPHRRGDVARRRRVHGAEVAAEQGAADARDEGARGAAGHDVQDRRRVVGEQVEVVLEVLPADVEARGRGPLGHVVRRRVVARRAREAVAAGEVGDVLQCGLVLHDPCDGHRLAELLRRVVVAVLAIRPCGRREHAVRRRPPARGCASCFSPCCRGRSHRRPCPGTLAESGPPRQGPGADQRARCRKTRAMRGFSDTHRRRSAATTSVGSRTTWRCGEAEDPEAARGEDRVALAVALERPPRAMEPPAVDLDDEPAARPVEVDLEAADDRVHPRPGDAVRVAEREERVFELAPRERVPGGVLAKQRREERRPGPARMGRHDRFERGEVEQLQHLRLVERALHRPARERRGQVEQRPRRRRDRHARVDAALLGQQRRSSVDADARDGRAGS